MSTAMNVRTFDLSQKQFESIRTLVKSISGISLADGKQDLVRSRLNKRLRQLGIDCYDEYIAMVKGDRAGQEITFLLDAISTNVTHFFREPAHFDYLADMLRQRAEKGSRRLRIWSAGCSSGEEPYTIAMAASEAISDLSGWDAKVLATDISTNVLGKAKLAVYGADAVHKLDRSVQSRYFKKIGDKPGGEYQVAPATRSLVSFARLNLMGSWPMKGPFDAIFCRNVMIYFEKATQAELVSRYWDLLAPGGMLFIGHSENLTGIKHGFESVRPTIYRKVV